MQSPPKRPPAIEKSVWIEVSAYTAVFLGVLLLSQLATRPTGLLIYRLYGLDSLDWMPHLVRFGLEFLILAVFILVIRLFFRKFFRRMMWTGLLIALLIQEIALGANLFSLDTALNPAIIGELNNYSQRPVSKIEVIILHSETDRRTDAATQIKTTVDPDEIKQTIEALQGLETDWANKAETACEQSGRFSFIGTGRGP